MNCTFFLIMLRIYGDFLQLFANVALWLIQATIPKDGMMQLSQIFLTFCESIYLDQMLVSLSLLIRPCINLNIWNVY